MHVCLAGNAVSRYTGTDNLELMAAAVKYNQFLIDAVRAHAPTRGTILDIGAGLGTFAVALKADGFAVRCVESDPRQAGLIAAKGLDVVSSVQAVPDDSIDYLYSLNVLEHIGDDVGALRRWRRKLKPGGVALIYVPAFPLLFSSMDRKVGHFRRYRRAELVEKLRAAGFQVARARYVDCLGFFAALLFRIIGDETGHFNRRALIAFDRVIFPISATLDLALSRVFGKNLLVVASRQHGDAGQPSG